MQHHALFPAAIFLALALPGRAQPAPEPAAAPPQPPQPPRVRLDTRFPTLGGKVIAVRAGQNLQAALDAARPGDTLELQAGATWVGNFVLPRKENPRNRWIVLRSSALRQMPEGQRVSPRQAALMPRIMSASAQPALRASRGAHHFRVAGLEVGFERAVKLSYNIVSLGEGDETSLEQLPHDITIDRCFIHGTTLAHSKRGVQLNGSRLAVVDSDVREIHGLGQDTQAIMGWNGTGPFKIENNFLEAPGENIIFGGSDPAIPDLVPSDIEIRRNHFFKPVRWMQSIIPSPSIQAQAAAAGRLAAGTYYYRAQAHGPVGGEDSVASTASSEVAVTLGAGQAGALISWPQVLYGEASEPQRATSYRVFRTADAPGVEGRKWTPYTIKAEAGGAGAVAFADEGAEGNRVGEWGDSPREMGQRWSVKNLLELKSAQRVVVEDNVLENNWGESQSGNAVLFTVRNQDGKAPWSVVQDVLFRRNIVRHSGSAFQMLGRDYTHPSQPSLRFEIRDNLFYDINGAKWNSAGMFLGLSGGVDDLVIDHNTSFQSGHITEAGEGAQNQRFRFTNNLLLHNELGMRGQAAATGLGRPETPDDGALEKYFPEAIVRGNAFIGTGQRGGEPSDFSHLYPAGNFFPLRASDAGLVDAAKHDYRLKPNSPLLKKGTDGKDVGADIPALMAATRGVASEEKR